MYVGLAGMLLATACSGDDGGEALVGTWRPVQAPESEIYDNFDWDSARITFYEDGKYAGTDGCNPESGTYEVSDDGEFTIDGDLTTAIGCPDGWIDYSFLFALVQRVSVDSKGHAIFESGSGKLLLELEPVENENGSQ